MKFIDMSLNSVEQRWNFTYAKGIREKSAAVAPFLLYTKELLPNSLEQGEVSHV